MILTGFAHHPGKHCGSAALADALAVQGLRLSEPMVFGLGAGLGFYCVEAPGHSPGLIFQGRSASLERTACDVLGVRATERTAETAGEAWAGAVAALGRGIAPVLETELSRLPYARSRTPFGGHRIVLAGRDEARGLAFVADGERPGLEEVPVEVLDAARAAVAPPFGRPGRPWLEVDLPAPARPLREAVPEALRRQAREALLDADGGSGVSALERFAETLPAWPARAASEAARAFTFRYAWQVIERRGTGGGLFRLLYAAFLREAGEVVPGLAGLGLAPRAEALAAAWSGLAAAFRELSDRPGAGVPPAVADAARALARDERRFFEDLAARVR